MCKKIDCSDAKWINDVFCGCFYEDAEQSVKDQSNEVSSSGSDQKNTADGQSGGSGSANAAGVRAKVESVEDHKKLNCIGMDNVELKHCIVKSQQCGWLHGTVVER